MSRRHFLFECDGDRLAATLDLPEGDTAPETGLLIVSGGNETRAGAWSGQAQLAAQIAAHGFAVLRFDRRGVGDSEGANTGFRGSAADIAAAMAAFREHCAQLRRVVGMGNCDAASALMLAGGAGCDVLVLANPWTFDEDAQEAPQPAAIRAHYRQRLADRNAIRRLLTGKVSLRSLFTSLKQGAAPPPPPSALAQAMRSGIEDFAGQAIFPIAGRDRTGQTFLSVWGKDERVRLCPQASHSFVEPDARPWLENLVLEVLRG